jgi:hypothetical protein
MMLSTLMRLPLVSASGIFASIERMPECQWLARLSPLSYCADLIGHSFGGGPFRRQSPDWCSPPSRPRSFCWRGAFIGPLAAASREVRVAPAVLR